MMATFIKQHLSNIWSSIDENVKQHWNWAENSFACNKKWVYLDFLYIYIYINFLRWKNPWFCLSYYLVLLSSIVTRIFS